MKLNVVLFPEQTLYFIRKTITVKVNVVLTDRYYDDDVFYIANINTYSIYLYHSVSIHRSLDEYAIACVFTYKIAYVFKYIKHHYLIIIISRGRYEESVHFICLYLGSNAVKIQPWSGVDFQYQRFFLKTAISFVLQKYWPGGKIN